MVTFADQLAYLSKSDADKAVMKLSRINKLYLFCGCCSLKKPVKIEPIKIYSKFTSYKDYWEVYVQYFDEDGITRDKPLDLAYVWKKGLFGFKTIGSILKLEHDPCVKPNEWDKVKPEE